MGLNICNSLAWGIDIQFFGDEKIDKLNR